MPWERLALELDRPKPAFKLCLQASHLTTPGLSLPVYKNTTCLTGLGGIT